MYIVRRRLTGVGKLLLSLSFILAHKVDKLARGSLTVLYKAVFFDTSTGVSYSLYELCYSIRPSGVASITLP